MLELIPVPVLMMKTNQIKNGKARSANEDVEGLGVALLIMLLVQLLIMGIFIYIFYRNFIYIYKCVPKNQKVFHYILAFFFNFLYFIYRILLGGKCKY